MKHEWKEVNRRWGADSLGLLWEDKGGAVYERVLGGEAVLGRELLRQVERAEKAEQLARDLVDECWTDEDYQAQITAKMKACVRALRREMQGLADRAHKAEATTGQQIALKCQFAVKAVKAERRAATLAAEHAAARATWEKERERLRKRNAELFEQTHCAPEVLALESMEIARLRLELHTSNAGWRESFSLRYRLHNKKLAALQQKLREAECAAQIEREESAEIIADLSGALAVGHGEDLKPCPAKGCPGHLGPKARAAVAKAREWANQQEALLAAVRWQRNAFRQSRNIVSQALREERKLVSALRDRIEELEQGYSGAVYRLLARAEPGARADNFFALRLGFGTATWAWRGWRFLHNRWLCDLTADDLGRFLFACDHRVDLSGLCLEDQVVALSESLAEPKHAYALRWTRFLAEPVAIHLGHAPGAVYGELRRQARESAK